MGYRGKVAEQARARELRLEGKTLLQIAQQLGVSKASVSLWVRDIDMEIRRGSLNPVVLMPSESPSSPRSRNVTVGASSASALSTQKHF